MGTFTHGIHCRCPHHPHLRLQRTADGIIAPPPLCSWEREGREGVVREKEDKLGTVFAATLGYKLRIQSGGPRRLQVFHSATKLMVGYYCTSPTLNVLVLIAVLSRLWSTFTHSRAERAEEVFFCRFVLACLACTHYNPKLQCIA